MNSDTVDAPAGPVPSGSTLSYRLKIDDNRKPAGRDGKGWNRLAIIPMAPTTRCALKPRYRQAALDTLRGMASFGELTAYDPCDHQESCDGCRQVTRERDDWQPEWLIREDQKGHVWLLGNRARGWAAFGYCYANWKALMDTTHIPRLQRYNDETGFYWAEAQTSPSS